MCPSLKCFAVLSVHLPRSTLAFFWSYYQVFLPCSSRVITDSKSISRSIHSHLFHESLPDSEIKNKRKHIFFMSFSIEWHSMKYLYSIKYRRECLTLMQGQNTWTTPQVQGYWKVPRRPPHKQRGQTARPKEQWCRLLCQEQDKSK